MNGPMLKKALPLTLALASVIVLGGAKAMQQGGDSAPAAAQASGQRSDGQIEMDVVAALDASAALKNDLITAATVQGDVTLSGTVSSDSSKQLAESLASHVQGVGKVVNNLKIGNPQDAANAAGDASIPQSDDDNQAPAPDQGAAQPPQYNNAPQQQAPPDQGSATAPPPPGRPQYAPYPQGPGYPPPPGAGYPPPPGYGYPPPPPGYGYPYAQQRPAPRYAVAKGPVTVPQGTLVQLRTSEALESKHAKDGTPVEFTVIRDVAVGGVLAIPRGATIHGVVTESKNAGTLAGSAELALQLTSLDLGGQTYPITSDQFKVKGPNKGERTAGSAIGGAILGAIIGGAVGRGEGAAIGAGAGAAAGTATSAASSGPRAWIPAEALVTFHLAGPVTVNPVSQEEADRLAQGLYPGGPTLYRRGYYGSPYPYGYPPVYYRPYFVEGGYYYWR
jgi:hypothetical protein